MAIINCDECGHPYSNLRHRGCPKCNEKIKDGNVEPQESKTKVINIVSLFITIVVVAIPIWVFYACTSFLLRPKTASQIAAEECMIRAQIAGKKSGPPTFKFAEEANPDYAVMHFEEDGKRWTTLFVCD